MIQVLKKRSLLSKMFLCSLINNSIMCKIKLAQYFTIVTSALTLSPKPKL